MNYRIKVTLTPSDNSLSEIHFFIETPPHDYIKLDDTIKNLYSRDGWYVSWSYGA